MATITWQGDDLTNPTYWNDADNWDTGTVPAVNDVVIFPASTGNCELNADSAELGSLDFTNYTGTFTINYGKYLNVKGNVTLGSGMTFATGGGTTGIRIRDNCTFTSNGIVVPTQLVLYFNVTGKTFTLGDDLTISGSISQQHAGSTIAAGTNGITFTGSGASISSASALTLYDVTITGSAVKTHTFYFGDSNITVSNNLTINGNSGVNRLLVYSSSLGTARTITCNGTVTASNVDFRDITGAGSASWDLSAITGGSGDCGGNTGITFTTADDWYWNGSGTQNFSDYTYWYTATNGGGTQMASTRCPLPQDTCYINGDSIDAATTIAIDIPRVGGIDTTGASSFNLSTSVSWSAFQGLDFSSVNTFTHNYVGTSYQGRGTFNFNLNGKSPYTTTQDMIGGTINCTGNFASFNFTCNAGNFDSNSYNVSVRSYTNNLTSIRTLDMGTGDWSFWNNGGGNTLVINATNLTFSSTSGNMNFTATDNNNYSISGGGLDFNKNITISGGGTQIVTFGGSNAFDTFTINAPKTVKFTSGTTTTVNSLVATGTAGNEITLQSTTADSIATISDANGGTNECDYLNVIDITATQENTFYYGANGSADNATNWQATAATNVSIPQNLLDILSNILSNTTTSDKNILISLEVIDLLSQILEATTSSATNVTFIPEVVEILLNNLSSTLSTGSTVSVDLINLLNSILSNSVLASANVSLSLETVALLSETLSAIASSDTSTTAIVNVLNLILNDLSPSLTTTSSISVSTTLLDLVSNILSGSVITSVNISIPINLLNASLTPLDAIASSITNVNVSLTSLETLLSILSPIPSAIVNTTVVLITSELTASLYEINTFGDALVLPSTEKLDLETLNNTVSTGNGVIISISPSELNSSVLDVSITGEIKILMDLLNLTVNSLDAIVSAKLDATVTAELLSLISSVLNINKITTYGFGKIIAIILKDYSKQKIILKDYSKQKIILKDYSKQKIKVR
jgi:hypothetical protein